MKWPNKWLGFATKFDSQPLFWPFNLSFTFPNGKCKFIFDNYISRTFQWFTQSSIWTSIIICTFVLKVQNIIGLARDITWDCWDILFHICESVFESHDILPTHSPMYWTINTQKNRGYTHTHTHKGDQIRHKHKRQWKTHKHTLTSPQCYFLKMKTWRP